MLEIDLVTLNEAQYLLRRPQEEINRAIDRGEVEKLTEVVTEPAKPKRPKHPKPRARRARFGRSQQRVFGYVAPRTVSKTVRKLGAPELLYLALEHKMHQDLTPAGRKKLYEAIKAQAPNATVISVGSFQLPLRDAAKELAKRYRALKSLRAGIVESSDRDPVLKGSDISVYAIAGLAEGQTVEEILEDYPSLTKTKVERAIEYAGAYPKKGRPFPKRSFKRAAAALVASGALDLPMGDEADVAPELDE